MISFKQYLNERKVKYQGNFKTITTLQMITGLGIPVFEQYWASHVEQPKNPIFFHVTSLHSFDNILQLQKLKNQLPTFTCGSNGVAHYLFTNKENTIPILIRLKGIVTVNALLDLGSAVDENGYRWILPGAYETTLDGGDLFKNILLWQQFMLGEMIELSKNLIKKYNISYTDSVNFEGPKDFEKFLKYIHDNYKKAYHELVNSYFSYAKKVIHSSLGQDIYNTIVLLIHRDFNKTFNNDERIVSRIEVEKVWVIDDELDKDELQRRIDLVKKKTKKYYCGVITSEEVFNIEVDPEFCQFKDTGKYIPRCRKG